MAAFWPIGTAQIIRIVSYPIRKKSRFWLFCMWSVKEMYNALLPKTDYRDKGRGHDRRLVIPESVVHWLNINTYATKVSTITIIIFSFSRSSFPRHSYRLSSRSHWQIICHQIMLYKLTAYHPPTTHHDSRRDTFETAFHQKLTAVTKF